MHSARARPNATARSRSTTGTSSASGRALMSGIHALVRLLLEQRRLDQRRGLDTGVFISGYEGSPLGGLDQELARAHRHLDPLGVVFRPGLNEELAATAVSGTQLLGELFGTRPRRDRRLLVRQEPGPRSRRRRDAPRQRHGHRTARRGGRADRRRPGGEVLDAAERLRAALSQPDDADPRARDRARDRRPGPARRRAVARVRPLDGPEDRHRARRRDGDGRRRRTCRPACRLPAGAPPPTRRCCSRRARSTPSRTR